MHLSIKIQIEGEFTIKKAYLLILKRGLNQ